MSYFASNLVMFANQGLQLAYSIVVTILIQVVVIYILFRNSKELKKLLDVMKYAKAGAASEGNLILKYQAPNQQRMDQEYF
jgi:hypothetical protein